MPLVRSHPKRLRGTVRSLAALAVVLVGLLAGAPGAGAAGWSGSVSVHLHWSSSSEGSSLTHNERAIYYFDGTTTPGGSAGPLIWDQPTTWTASYSEVATGGSSCGAGTATKTGQGTGTGTGNVRFDDVGGGSWEYGLTAVPVSGPGGTFPTSQTHPCGPSPGPDEPPFQLDTLGVPLLPAGTTPDDTTVLVGTKTRTGITFCCDQVDYAWRLTRDPDPPACANGRDDDNDGLTDYSATSSLGDPDCSSADDDSEGAPPVDPWDPLVTIASDQITDSVGAPTRVYLLQLRDLVCASARSGRPVCDDIRPAYDSAQWATDGVGCEDPSPSCWVFNVFDDLLRRPVDPAAEAQAIQANARSKFFLSCLLGGRDAYGCLILSRSAAIPQVYGRTFHFLEGIEGSSQRVTNAVVEARKTDIGAVESALDTFRSLHDKFVQAAVLPSYDLRGLPAWAVSIAKASAPPAARCYREAAIHRAFTDIYDGYGDYLYRGVSDAGEEAIYDNSLCRALA